MNKIFLFLAYVIASLTAIHAVVQDEPSIEELQKEIAGLKKSLKETQTRLEQAIDAGFVPVEDGFASVVEIINTLPENLELNAKKPWDQAQWKDAVETMSNNSVGKPFKCKPAIADIDIQPNPQHVKDRTQPKYHVKISFRSSTFAIAGYSIQQNVATNFNGLFFEGDEEIVEKAKKLRVGKNYTIGGIINKFDFKSLGQEKIRIAEIGLARIEFEAMK